LRPLPPGLFATPTVERPAEGVAMVSPAAVSAQYQKGAVGTSQAPHQTDRAATRRG